MIGKKDILGTVAGYSDESGNASNIALVLQNLSLNDLNYSHLNGSRSPSLYM